MKSLTPASVPGSDIIDIELSAAVHRSPWTVNEHGGFRGHLDPDAMQSGADRLIGKHDFTTFRSVHCQAKSPVKTLDSLTVNYGAGGIQVNASARSFMHNQVRSIVGALKLVGEGKWTPDDVTRALAACDRSACAPVAPAHGLYLARVDY